MLDSLTTFGQLLLVVIGFGAVMGVLWQRSERARARASAARLLDLGRSQLESDPASALAYATASLEEHDDLFARRFVIELLAQGPVAQSIWTGPSTSPAFSPDGRFLALDLVDLSVLTDRLTVLREDGE